SRIIAESMSWSGPWLKGDSMLRLTVTNWRLARMCWPSSPMRKSKNSTAAFGCGAFRASPSPVARAIAGGITNQSSGAPLVLARRAKTPGARAPKRLSARRDQIGEEAVTLAHGHAVRGDDVAEQP